MRSSLRALDAFAARLAHPSPAPASRRGSFASSLAARRAAGGHRHGQGRTSRDDLRSFGAAVLVVHAVFVLFLVAAAVLLVGHAVVVVVALGAAVVVLEGVPVLLELVAYVGRVG